jgi:hypothetical protein
VKINAASEPRNFKLMHAVKPQFISSDAALKVKRILIFYLNLGLNF